MSNKKRDKIERLTLASDGGKVGRGWTSVAYLTPKKARKLKKMLNELRIM